jgi:hypothetical protein
MSLFPVALFVTAIADGAVTRDTPQKAKERLSLIVSKIPKEQNTSVELKEGTLDLKMRVFVAGSEDAKAVSEYIQTHSNQTPSPFVILARELPMALLYDKNSLDLTDASVADRSALIIYSLACCAPFSLLFRMSAICHCRNSKLAHVPRREDGKLGRALLRGKAPLGRALLHCSSDC